MLIVLNLIAMLKRFFLDDKFIFSAIALNAVLIFFLSFPDFAGNHFLLRLDDLFIIYFIIELIVKIRVYKFSGYFGDAWHFFDFILILGSTPALLSNFMGLPDASFLLVFRLFRLVRLVRFLHFIPHIKHLLVGLGRAFKASIFVIIALFLINFILAVLSVHLFGKAAPEYFENPMKASFTIFQLFTLEGWNDIPEAVSKYYKSDFAGSIARLYFVMIVLLGGIFGMSMANAIFVDEMTIDNTEELEAKIDSLQEQVNGLQLWLQNHDKT